MRTPALGRRALAEFLGTALLVAVVVGSGIAGSELSGGDAGQALLINAVATAGGLAALILAFGPVSGAHLNPAVTAADAWFGGIGRRSALAYGAAQVGGAVAGAALANVMYGRSAIEAATTVRDGAGVWVGEVVATFGLLVVVFALARTGRAALAPFAVSAYIAAGYFFTSSTSFANPAVTVGRMFSDTFAGIDPTSVPGFVAAQAAGAVLAVAAIGVLYPDLTADDATRVVVPHPGSEEP
jgi:glycerol uptake facilitator-like aquaporin